MVSRKLTAEEKIKLLQNMPEIKQIVSLLAAAFKDAKLNSHISLCYKIDGEDFSITFKKGKIDDAPKYNANFLWGYEDHSLEAIAYEFANAKTQQYQKECWEELKKRLKK